MVAMLPSKESRRRSADVDSRRCCLRERNGCVLRRGYIKAMPNTVKVQVNRGSEWKSKLKERLWRRDERKCGGPPIAEAPFRVERGFIVSRTWLAFLPQASISAPVTRYEVPTNPGKYLLPTGQTLPRHSSANLKPTGTYQDIPWPLAARAKGLRFQVPLTSSAAGRSSRLATVPTPGLQSPAGSAPGKKPAGRPADGEDLSARDSQVSSFALSPTASLPTEEFPKFQTSSQRPACSTAMLVGLRCVCMISQRRPVQPVRLCAAARRH